MHIRAIDSLHLSADEETLKVITFNVGQGDHILLQFPTGRYGIIDCFFDDKRLNQVEPPALTYFKAIYNELLSEIREANPKVDEKSIVQQAEKSFRDTVIIDIFCISHADYDHIRGALPLLNWLSEKSVIINRFWLSGAKDEFSYRVKFISFVKDLLKSRKALFSKKQKESRTKIKSFESTMTDLLSKIHSWKYCDIKGNKPIKDYMVGYKIVDNRIVESGQLSVECIGPLDEQLKKFEELSYVNHIKKVLGDIFIWNEPDLLAQEDARFNELTEEERNFWAPIRADKNLMSHLIWFQFYDYHLIFAGDTHRNIIEECIQNYIDRIKKQSDDSFLKNADFIKVAHHGSKNSSSKQIWNLLLSKDKSSQLAISAGRHNGYKHPSSDFLKDLINKEPKPNIYSTNICSFCLKNELKEIDSDELDDMVKDNWYNLYLKNSKNSNWNIPDVDKKVNEALEVAFSGDLSRSEMVEEYLRQLSVIDTSEQGKEHNARLLGYEFSFNKDLKQVKPLVYIAEGADDCFFSEHNFKLRSECID